MGGKDLFYFVKKIILTCCHKYVPNEALLRSKAIAAQYKHYKCFQIQRTYFRCLDILVSTNAPQPNHNETPPELQYISQVTGLL